MKRLSLNLLIQTPTGRKREREGKRDINEKFFKNDQLERV